MKARAVLALSVVLFWFALTWLACRRIESYIDSGALKLIALKSPCTCPADKCKCCGCSE